MVDVCVVVYPTCQVRHMTTIQMTNSANLNRIHPMNGSLLNHLIGDIDHLAADQIRRRKRLETAKLVHRARVALSHECSERTTQGNTPTPSWQRQNNPLEETEDRKEKVPRMMMGGMKSAGSLMHSLLLQPQDPEVQQLCWNPVSQCASWSCF
ncbi:uncharacterized protein LOC144003442 [Festucalex cinctus]